MDNNIQKQRVWIYCRCANDDGDMSSLKMQKESLRKYAEKKCLTVVGITTEIGSGCNFERNGLAEIEIAAAKGEYEILLIKSISRLGRDFFKTIQLIEKLQLMNISIITCDGSNVNSEVTVIKEIASMMAS